MNESSSSTPDAVKLSGTYLSPGALVLWLSLQTGAIALAAGRVPLYAEYPQPGEFHAVIILSSIQWLAVALLFPVLWSNWRGAVGVVVSGVVVLLLAGALSASDLREILFIGSYFARCVVTVFAWGEVAQTMRAKMVVAGALGAVNLGGLLLVYLREDLGTGLGGGGKWKYGALWPLLQNPQNPAGFCWISMGFVLALACLIHVIRWRRNSQPAGIAR